MRFLALIPEVFETEPDAEVNIHELGKKALSQLNDPKKDPVYVRADKTVPFGSVALVLDTLQQAGIQTVNMVTQPIDSKSGKR